jgi:GNAT superfamily N-acetyltransferase
MSVVNPSPARIEALRRRWDGQEARLRAIAADLVDGRDWTVHLSGLPFVEEVPPLAGEARGRDLRGANLKRFLVPPVHVAAAEEGEAAVVAALAYEGLRWNTPLEATTPFPVAPESAADVRLAMHRGEHFLLARCAGRPVGVARWARRTELASLVGGRDYAEISGLAVLPPHRRRGVGEMLRASAETEALAAGFEHALLRTTLELGLVPWYERAGYAVAQVRQATCEEGTTYLDAVMVRRLGAAEADAAAALPTRRRLYRR